MNQFVVAARFDLPFYLRLPPNVFHSYDSEFGVCSILPMQRLGETSFGKKTCLLEKSYLLDGYCESPLQSYEVAGYDYKMTSVLENNEEKPTLEIFVKKNGGFKQLRAYSEIIIWIYVKDKEVDNDKVRNRVFENLNHFLNLYSLITQDSYLHEINEKLHPYYIEYLVGQIPEELKDAPPIKILTSLDKIKFNLDMGQFRQITISTNSIDDLFPGKILEDKFMNILISNATKKYDMPLHYKLILESQRQLKLKNFHVCIIEAQTAFESYISTVISRFLLDAHYTDVQIQEYLNSNMLKRRLRKLDELIRTYKQSLSESYCDFVDSELYNEWNANLYGLRNQVVHAGLRDLNFDKCKGALSVGKRCIFHFEDMLPNFRNDVQIYKGIDFIQETPGRVIFE